MMFDEKLIKRFWKKVDKKGVDECWNWTGYKNADGYGNFTVDAKKRWNAHRIAYIITFGEPQPGICVCHKCDNPSCVNPNHLFAGTVKDNVVDRIEKGRTNPKPLTQQQKEFIKSSGVGTKELSNLFGVAGRTINKYKYS